MIPTQYLYQYKLHLNTEFYQNCERATNNRPINNETTTDIIWKQTFRFCYVTNHHISCFSRSSI